MMSISSSGLAGCSPPGTLSAPVGGVAPGRVLSVSDTWRMMKTFGVDLGDAAGGGERFEQPEVGLRHDVGAGSGDLSDDRVGGVAPSGDDDGDDSGSATRARARTR